MLHDIGRSINGRPTFHRGSQIPGKGHDDDPFRAFWWLNDEKDHCIPGIQGAYSEDATYLFFGDDIETVPCPDFETVFNKVDKGETLYGVVPVENSLEGSITLVNDLLLDNDLTVKVRCSWPSTTASSPIQTQI